MSTDWLARDLSILTLKLLKEDDLISLGSNLARACVVDQTPCFDDLLQAIDEANAEAPTERDVGR